MEVSLGNCHLSGCNMSIKINFLKSHLNAFPANFEDVSDENGEGFHQDIRVMEERYQGRWNTHMMDLVSGYLFHECSFLFVLFYFIRYI